MKTRAAILYELNKPLVIEDVEIPLLKKGQLLVKIKVSGVCRAQYNEMTGLKGPDKFLPHLLGHEASGIVEDIGEGVTKVKQGDYVSLSWIKGHGLDGMGTQYKLGTRIINAGSVTTFSDYTVVSENRVTKIPQTIAHDVAAIIGCAVLTGCGIVHNTCVTVPQSSIAVFGVGGIGLSVILGAKQRGSTKIIAVDIADHKLEFAKRMGATHVINASSQDVLKNIETIVAGGVDYAVDASGNKTAMENAFNSINVKGKCVIAGNLAKNEKMEIHPFELIKGKQIVGTWGGESLPDRDIPLYINAFQKGDLAIDHLITHRFGLEDVNKAIDVLVQGEAGRIVLNINS